jgi:hypothetical protein
MESDKEDSMKYLKQIAVAVALLLVLYGIVQLLNFLFDLANFPGVYYLLAFFQIIALFLSFLSDSGFILLQKRRKQPILSI